MTSDKNPDLASVLRAEASAIAAAADRLDPPVVENAVSLLAKCESKVVFTGVGKSGIVAQKCAATFTSVGLVAVFLNPLDALHGDLGIVRDGDVVVFVSNSGESGELLALVPYVKKRAVSIVGILGRTGSTLAHECDVVLDAAVEREACPIDLVPTSSTAVAMAIGDALAVLWMDRRRVSAEDFALNHPGGALGRRLSLLVRDLMVPASTVAPLAPTATLVDVIDTLTRHAIGAVWVHADDDTQRLGGIITDGDLRRALTKHSADAWSALLANDLMTRSPITIAEATPAFDALALMERNARKSISVLPVIGDNGEVSGMLRLHDLVKAGLA